MKNVILVALCLFSLIVQAGKEPTYESVIDNAAFMANATTSITDPEYLAGNLGIYQHVSVVNKVMLEINQDEPIGCITADFDVEIEVEIKLWNENGVMTTHVHTLEVSYTESSGTYKEKNTFLTSGYHKMEVEIVSISDPSYNSKLRLRASIDIERYRGFNMSQNDFATAGSVDLNNDGEIVISWNSIEGAEEYDLEWTYVDNYSRYRYLNTGLFDPSDLGYSFKNNSTRVTVKETTYKVSNVYEQGFVLFRLRGVGYGGPDFKHRIEGDWSGPESGTDISSDFTILKNFQIIHTQSPDQEPKLNWQYKAQFAEWGKSKESIVYYDGTNRKRETVVKSNTEEAVLISENLYDYHGREAITTIPGPKNSKIIKLHEGAGSSWTFNKSDFDQNSNFNDPPVMTWYSSSEKYYSPSNNDINSNDFPWANYTPDAEGYPYVRTIYLNDNTNRPKYVSGVGPLHAIKPGFEHVKRYMYGVPFQEELDRLLGNNVGYADHYTKELVMDENGQSNMTYKDMKGNVIITTLAGLKPDNLEGLGGVPEFMDIDLLSGVQKNTPEGTLELSKTFIVPYTNNYEFDYGFTGATPSFCSTQVNTNPFAYVIDINLTGENGVINPPAPPYSPHSVHTSNEWFSGGSSNNAFNIPSATATLTPGTYTITKKVRIYEPAYQVSLNQYLDPTNNPCLKTLDEFEDEFELEIDFSGCDITCAECETKLGSLNDFKTKALAALTDQNITPTQADIDDIEARYDEMLKDCKNICEDNVCDSYLSVLEFDISPEGQYAGYSLIDHPEYCFYQECLAQEDSREYDRAMMETQTFQEADAAGFMNPINTNGNFAFVGGDPYFMSGPGNLTTMSNTLNQFVNQSGYASVWDYAIFMVLCYDETDPTYHPADAINIAYCLSNNTYTPGNCDPMDDFIWNTFRSIYLSEKAKLIDQASACNSITVPSGKTPRFTMYADAINSWENDYQLNTTSAAGPINADITQHCADVCEGYADDWMDELLASCTYSGFYLNSPLYTQVRNALIDVCKNGCDNDHPFGSSSEAPGTGGTYSSFQHVLDNLLNGCDANVITFPLPYGHPAGMTPGAQSENCPDDDPCIANIPDAKVNEAVTQYYRASQGGCNTCISCELMMSLYDHIVMYSVPAYDPATNTSTEMKQIETWVNTLKINNPTLPYPHVLLTYHQIEQFNDSCDAMLDPSKILCTELMPRIPYKSNCESQLLAQAKSDANAAYNEYLDELKRKFRKDYVTQWENALKNSEFFTMTYEILEYNFTLYYYDQAGNLVQTIPPAAVEPLSMALTKKVHKHRIGDVSEPNPYFPPHDWPLKTHYDYNTLNQLTQQSTPDANTSEFFYDNLGRMVVSQNAEQALASPKKYSYTEYDPQGRIIEVGEIATSSPMDASVAFDASLLSTWMSGGVKSQISHTYYDEAPFSITYSGFSQENLRSRVSTITYKETSGGGYDNAIHYSYDIHGNVHSLIQEVPSLASDGAQFKKIDYEYDLISGNVNQVYFQKGEDDQFIHRYDYDADNRIVSTHTSLDGIHWDTDAEYDYYKHGPLARTEIGELNVQGNDYAYTIQGWLKGMNSTTLNERRDIGHDGDPNTSNPTQGDNRYVARDEFGYSLSYYEDLAASPVERDYLPVGTGYMTDNFDAIQDGSTFQAAAPSLYNGNIRNNVTAIREFMDAYYKPVGKAYKYDQLNRIKSSRAYHNMDLSANSWNSSGSALSTYQTDYTYDENGNIQLLTRTGNLLGQEDMDDLEYHYIAGTNQLDYVEDHINPSVYTTDLGPNAVVGSTNQTSGNYDYDAIGNLIQDLNEEIQSIEWTVTGKISKINPTALSTKSTLEFTYDALGNRIMKKEIPSSGPTVYTYYVRDAAGNIMSTYYHDGTELKWESSVIYGSSRLGVIEPEDYCKKDINYSCAISPISMADDNWMTDIDIYLSGSGGLQGYIDAQIASVLPNLTSTEKTNLRDFIMTEIAAISGGDPKDQELITNAFMQWVCRLACFELDAGFTLPSSFSTLITSLFKDPYTLAGMQVKEGIDTYFNDFVNGTIHELKGLDYCDKCLVPTPNSCMADNNLYLIGGGQRFVDYVTITLGTDVITWTFAQIATYLPNTDPNFQAFMHDLFENHMLQLAMSIEDDEAIVNAWLDWLCLLQCYNLGDGFTEYMPWQDHFQTFIVGAINDQGYTMEQAVALFWDDFLLMVTQDLDALQYTNACILPELQEASAYRGLKKYEMSNHLGNIQVVISDKRTTACTVDGGGDPIVEYYNAEVLSANDYYPFGMIMPGRSTNPGDYRFGFNGMEKDDEVKGSGNSLDFGARIYDPRMGRWFSPDPYSNLYAPISPYAFALNSPIRFVDADGNVVVGSDGNPVTYTRGEDGTVEWSSNATADIMEVGNAMLSTEFGEKSFNKWQNAETKITIRIDRELAPTDKYGETKPTLAADGYGKVNSDGQYEEAEVIIYEKSIERGMEEGSGSRLENASKEEAVGTVGTHEVYHNEKEQINRDIRRPNELKQSTKKNLPINSEINFRKEYHQNNPGQKNEKTWQNNYENKGYKGIEEE